MGCSRCGKKRTEANAARLRKLAQRAAERKALAEQIAKQNGRLQQQQEPVVVTEVVEQVQPDAPEPEASTEQPPAPDSSSSVDVTDEVFETEAEGQEEGE